jgi:hypothetical protein
MFGGDSLGWQIALYGLKKSILSWLAIAAVMEHLGWLKEIHGKISIWLAEQ